MTEKNVYNEIERTKEDIEEYHEKVKNKAIKKSQDRFDDLCIFITCFIISVFIIRSIFLSIIFSTINTIIIHKYNKYEEQRYEEQKRQEKEDNNM